MENNELNNKIIEKVRDKIVISNLESEENMRLNRKKQVLSLVAVLIIMLTGSFMTVNATTNGELVEKVKDTIKVIFVNEDGKEREVKGTTYKDSNNHTIEKYNFEDGGTLEIDKTNLDEHNMNVDGTLKDKEFNILIKNEK